MEFDYLHLYVPDFSEADYCYQKYWGFTRLEMMTTAEKITGIYQQGQILLIISAPNNSTSIINRYLVNHPPGIGEVAFQMPDLSEFLTKLNQLNIASEPIVHPLTNQPGLSFTVWGDLRHSVYPPRQPLVNPSNNPTNVDLTTIDHVVLNIASEEFYQASQWHQQLFGWSVQQKFTITTPNSGLYSEALINQNGKVQFNLNRPSSPHSQIQTFLEKNRGPGIQHVALSSPNIIQTVDNLQKKGIKFLSIPSTYYDQKRTKFKDKRDKSEQYPTMNWSSLESLGILVDENRNNSQKLLLQIFTQPCYGKGTLFWEIIQRCQQAKGFGEGNFQALYEAVETMENSPD